MHVVQGSRGLAFATMLLVVVSHAVGTAQTAVRRQPALATSTLCLVIGTAWKGDTQPYPDARIRLRNVETGRAVARTLSDADGRFRFEGVDAGVYVVELLSTDDKVLAIGDLFGVPAGGQATTLVRLSSKAPWFTGFFSNAAAAAIAAASTLGVTAVGSNGTPASGQ